jgi:2-amino-4-hydroxy-6-hydroxymethyldihydropteridine diphosphokinase
MIYYLSLGANLGNREQTIRLAMHQIEQQIGSILRCSSFYYSQPWGFQSENPFCNLCCAVESSLSPLDVLSHTQAIERALGRTTKSVDGHYHDRVIDIDIIRILDNGQEIYIDTPQLTVPHKLWQQRDFVRIPLAEILSETLIAQE